MESLQAGAASASIEIESEDYLDNVVWASLSEAQPDHVERNQRGARYRPEFAPFGASQDYGEESVAEIAAMLQPEQRLSLFTMHKPAIPAGYDVVREAAAYQMIAAKKFAPSSDARIVQLGAEDVAQMLKLVELTEPGPFNKRTNELGNFWGIREQDQLVAMAGIRMTAGKYIEISAVCTHPDWRGKGLGRLMMEHLSATIQQGGHVPFLHVFSTNASAVRLYRELGFRVARTMQLTAIVRSPEAKSS